MSAREVWTAVGIIRMEITLKFRTLDECRKKKTGVEQRKGLRTQAMVALRIKIRETEKTHQRKYGQRFRERNNNVFLEAK